VLYAVFPDKILAHCKSEHLYVNSQFGGDSIRASLDAFGKKLCGMVSGALQSTLMWISNACVRHLRIAEAQWWVTVIAVIPRVSVQL
jgi:hypothetical protein